MALPTDGNEHEHDTDHPDLTGVAGEMRAEWRAEQEAAAADAARAVAARARARRLVARPDARGRPHRGDASRRNGSSGSVEEVGDDLLALRCRPGASRSTCAPAIPIAFELVEHATQGGTRSASPPGVPRRAPRARRATRRPRRDVAGAGRHRRDAARRRATTSRSRRAPGAETVVPIAHVAWVSATRE